MLNKKTAVIHQPDFLPWLGFFHRFLFADLWVVLDNVQFVRGSKNCRINRNLIKTSRGPKWITVTVQKTPLNTNINDVLLSNQVNWKETHLNLIKENYSGAPFFGEIFPYFQRITSFKCEKMMDYNINSIDILSDMLDVKINKVIASSLDVTGKSNELLVDILKKVAASTYLSGSGAGGYYDPTLFESENINVVFQDFKYPVYSQFRGEFLPNLSSIDLLFNCGIEGSRDILKNA